MLDFSGNWSGTGTIENAGDAERIALNSGEFMKSNIVNTGANDVTLLQNNYDPTGDNVTLQYRTAATAAGIAAAAWNNYTIPFTSSGFVQLRITSTL